MNLLWFFIILLSLYSCSNKKEKKEIVEVLANETKIDSTESINKIDCVETIPTEIETASIDTFNIENYYNHFFKTSISSFKKLDYKEAFEQKTYVLNELDFNRGFIAFTTQNTPPSWDGDSETEYSYQLTYWIKPNGERIIALVKTELTWVSSESEIEFYIHTKSGINKFNPLERNWNFNDFAQGNGIEKLPQTFIENPPIEIYLPQKGKDIKINFSIHDYYEPEEILVILDSLNLIYNEIYINPLNGLIEKH